MNEQEALAAADAWLAGLGAAHAQALAAQQRGQEWRVTAVLEGRRLFLSVHSETGQVVGDLMPDTP